jgi:hypothetical protein
LLAFIICQIKCLVPIDVKRWYIFYVVKRTISRTMSDIESNLGTMVINEEEDSTMKQYGTAPGHSSYRYGTVLLTYLLTDG